MSNAVSPVASADARDSAAYAARAALGGARISTRELARRTGRSHAYWSKRLTGVQSLSVDDLALIAEHTGVSVESLVRAA